MAWTLHLLVWITVLNMSVSQSPQLPPYWGWGGNRHRQHDSYDNWQTASSALKYPSGPQLQYIPIPIDFDNQPVRNGPDCSRLNTRSSEEPHDSRMNERSIPSSSQEVRVYESRTEEMQRRSENGSSKILNNFLKPGRRKVTPGSSSFISRKRTVSSRSTSSSSSSTSSSSSSSTSSSSGEVPGQVDTNRIAFPGPTVRTHYTPEIPEKCRNSTFCEDAPNFPQQDIDKLIQVLRNTRRFQKDTLDVPDTPDINQRVGPIDESVELCQFEEKVVYPKIAMGADGNWYTLVNSETNPVQGYRVEICNLDSGPGCSGFVNFESGYQARCKQKYVYRSVTAFEKTADGIRTFEQSVKLPSCCSCVARHTIT